MLTQPLKYGVGHAQDDASLGRHCVDDGEVVLVMYREIGTKILGHGYLKGGSPSVQVWKEFVKTAYRPKKITEPPYRLTCHSRGRSKHKHWLAEEHTFPY
jgi:hypothetical protein